MMAVLPCQNAKLDVPPPQQQHKDMLTDLDPEDELDRQRDEVVRKASRCSLLGGTVGNLGNLLDDNSLSDEEMDLEALVAINAAKNNICKTSASSKETCRMLDEVPHHQPLPQQQSPRRCASEGRRRSGGIRRSLSLDGSRTFGDRNSWGGGFGSKARRGGKKPDFRWDKLNKEQPSQSTRSSSINNNNKNDDMPQPPIRWDDPTTLAAAVSSPTITTSTAATAKATASPRPQLRVRKPPRRTKSLDPRKLYGSVGGGGGEEKLKRSRPTIQRTDSKVRFCMETEVFEVPRLPKDMKTDLFYTKKEIKVFKAEKKEEKRELKQQKKLEKEKLKAAAAEAATAAAARSEEQQKTTEATTTSVSSSEEEVEQKELAPSSSEKTPKEGQKEPQQAPLEQPDPPAAAISSTMTSSSSSGLTLDEKLARFNARERKKKKALTLDQKIEKFQAKEKNSPAGMGTKTTSSSSIASC